MKKQVFCIVVILIIILGIFWNFRQKDDIIIIDSNTIVTGDYTIKEGERVIVSNNSIMTIEGDLVVKGEISCRNGQLNLIVNGSAVLENKLECNLGEELKEEQTGIGISMVIKDSLTLTEKAKIITNGHLQIVESSDLLVTTKEQIEELYKDTGNDTGDGNRLGPFIKKSEVSNSVSGSKIVIRPTLSKKWNQESSPNFFEIPKAQAAARMINLRGQIQIKTPPRGINPLVVMRFPNIDGFNFVKFWLIGPNGRNGRDDRNKSCDAEGKDGQNAMRLLVVAPKIKVQDFTLELGSGGNGGDAVTKESCEPVKAKGGKGGKAGNFKIIAFENFDILGVFTIYPGRGGDGGSAEAFGKDGDLTQDGADARAIGGDGENNEKAVRVLGTITGQKNISFGSMEGGNGGSALAVPGDGGDGRPCKSEKGGDAGKGVAEGGKGGSALIFLAGAGAKRTKDAQDIGGDGGFVKIIKANGGSGSICKPDKAGGKGGRGGDVKAIPGEGGMGGTKNGQKGQIDDETGGDGGNGGDGCPLGAGGLGGSGNPRGKNGKPGKNICVVIPKEKPTAAINIVPAEFIFEHDIGSTICPQLIGAVKITKTGTAQVSGWKLEGTLPAWLSMSTSGLFTGGVDTESFNVNFSCVLDEYISQTLSTLINFQLIDQQGLPVGQKTTLKVTGYINAQ